MTPRHIAVLDVGKTNVKLVLVETATLSEVQVLTRPNTVLPGPPYPHYDIEGIWKFLLDGLGRFQARTGVDAVTCSAHGACGVLLAQDGTLAAPVIDYEHDGPDALKAEYDRLRPGFGVTGSPRLPCGLNVGAQIHWQFARDPGLSSRVTRFVTYPQYWTGRLSGVWTTEVSSLGAHTDLWNVRERRFSTLVDQLGLAARMAPLLPAETVLGPILPAIAAATGLSPRTPVISGLHDSNASLYPHLLNRPAPFTVISTGTWMIAMAIGSRARLDPARDTLMNVSVQGDPVPSARFMGGREFEMICGPIPAEPTEADIAAVLAHRVMCFPSFEATSGPFPGCAPRWTQPRDTLAPGAVTAAASFYLALMTATCLSLIEAAGPLLVEGPFARNSQFLDMLTVASGLTPLRPAGATGTAIGAALLAGLRPPAPRSETRSAPAMCDSLSAYARIWRQTASV